MPVRFVLKPLKPRGVFALSKRFDMKLEFTATPDLQA